MRKCRKCGGAVIRVHRNNLQRIIFRAALQCRRCRSTELVLRGSDCFCPRCGGSRVTRLRKRDPIDRMRTGVRNLFVRFMGGKLHHCSFCRLQFYDWGRSREPAHAHDTGKPLSASAGLALAASPRGSECGVSQTSGGNNGTACVLRDDGG